MAPRGRSNAPGPEARPVERPARPAAARHIKRTRVLMSVRPRDSSPAARLQLEPLGDINVLNTLMLQMYTGESQHHTQTHTHLTESKDSALITIVLATRT